MRSSRSALGASGPRVGPWPGRKTQQAGWSTATLYDAVLFDLDDTLIDRRAAFLRWARSFYDAQPAVRAAVTWEEASRLLVEWDDRGAANRGGFRFYHGKRKTFQFIGIHWAYFNSSAWFLGQKRIN